MHVPSPAVLSKNVIIGTEIMMADYEKDAMLHLVVQGECSDDKLGYARQIQPRRHTH